MKIHVRTRQVQLDDFVRAHVERRLQLSLDRFSDRVQRVTVHLVDVNGPRGGKDKVCRIEARLRPTGVLFVEDADADLFVAIDRAADQAGEAVSRALKRDRDLARKAAQACAMPESSNAARSPEERGPARRSAS